MKKEKRPVSRTKEHPMILTVPEMIFTFLSIPFCIMSSYGLASGSADEFVKTLQLAFLMIGLMRLFRALGNRYRKPAPALKGLDLAAAGIMILCVVILQLKKQIPEAHEWGCKLFVVIVLAGRILSIVQEPKRANILQNIVLIGFVVFLTFNLWNKDTCFMGEGSTLTLAAYLSLINIMSFAFSHIRLDLLQNIVRRTYAAEILFGLLMLILSSSWILTFMEEGIASYKDALWYCFALVTTIGFGDITAVTDLGRTISVVLGIYGIIVVALITSIIVNFYGEIKKAHPEEEAGAENNSPE